MNTGKHSTYTSKKIKNQNNSSKHTHIDNHKNTFKIFIIIFFIFIIIALTLYFFFFYKKPDTNMENSIAQQPPELVFENSTTYELSNDGEAKANIFVEGAEYLEIIKFNVIPDKDISTVSTKFKNNSNESHKNVELRITLYNDKNEEISSLDYIIDNIEANGEVLAHGAIKGDLSDCSTCSVALRKK